MRSLGGQESAPGASAWSVPGASAAAEGVLRLGWTRRPSAIHELQAAEQHVAVVLVVEDADVQRSGGSTVRS